VNELERLYRKDPNASAFARGYLEYLAGIFDRLDVEAISRFAETLLDARERGARIFFFGNGGSAATASHFANDIAFCGRTWEKPFRAVSLADNVAMLTAAANDHGYDTIFTQQLRAQMEAGDVVVAISVSGNSPNVLAAVEYASANGATTIGLTGFDGGRLLELADFCVHAPTNPGEYGPAEDVHMIFDHLIGAYLMQVCASARS
jgi:D-sedoheptulose 7-phosphate isomerase